MAEKGKVLVVDDEPHQRLIMSEACKSMGYDVTIADTGKKALELIRYGNFDVLITDMQMPEMNGIRLLENVMIFDSSVSVILATAHGTIETAVEAMKKGAEDYILKPVEFSALELILTKVFKKRELVQENTRLISENEALKKALNIKYRITNTIGRHQTTQNLMADIEKHMKLKSPLLILGERGCGRNDIARMVHYNGPWANQPLIYFDTTEAPPDLHEKQLFGEELSVESGVRIQSRPGLVERAHQGTLVISNVHLLAKSCQANLSRVLREQKTQRAGGSRFYPVNVRIIATGTQAEFNDVTSQNQIRWDIHELLLENKIEVPPLRARAMDIPILTAAISKRVGEALGKTIDKIDKDVIEMLIRYDFPLNYRELETLVECAVIRCNENTLKLDHFGLWVAPRSERPLKGSAK